MKLLLRREQKSSMLGKISFILHVRAELTEEEKGYVDKYKMGDMLLYSRKDFTGSTEGLKGLAAVLAHRMTNLTIATDDLAKGKKIECKDIGEALAVESQIKEAATNMKGMLVACSTYGGEEVIEY